jgi:HPt (histidine-containing phosphotransfer) domain-containing protein
MHVPPEPLPNDRIHFPTRLSSNEVDQILNNKAENNPRPPSLAIASAITSDAVDMDVLNAFEELQLDNESDLIVELIDLYLQEMLKRILEFRKASTETDWVLLKCAGHNLRGTSGTLGVRYVAEICEKLERLNSHDSPQIVAALVQLIEYESAMARSALAAERQRRLGSGF